jgi:hypothetical protein
MANDLLSKIQDELDARILSLRPALAEYEQLQAIAEALPANDTSPTPAAPATTAPASSRARRTAARGAARSNSARGASATPPARVKGRNARKPASRGPVAQAIVVALEHGSHSTSELVMVTAIPASTINLNLRHLRRDGVVQKIKRGTKSAYALSDGHASSPASAH